MNIIALYVLVSAFLAAWAVYEADRQAYRDYQKRAAVEQEQAVREIANRCNVILEPSSTFQECLFKAISDYHTSDTKDKDLAAQQDMATWSYWTLIATWASLLVSIGGFVMLWFSLKQTREAISNDREVGHAQVRAYLGFEIMPPNDGFLPGQTPEAIFRIINTGQSPARKVRHTSFIDIFEHPLLDWQSVLLKEPTDLKIPSVTLRAGGDFNDSASLERRLTQEDFNAITNHGPKRIYLVAKVIYEDVFGQERMSELAAYLEVEYKKLPGEKFAGRFEWILSHVRNDST